MKSFVLKTAVTAVLMGVAAVAVAKGPPADKGNKPDSEIGNNLSVPTIMIGGGFANVVGCGDGSFSGHVAPSGDPVWYPYQMVTDHDGNVTELPEGYYFVQREHAWQAPCMNTELTTSVNGAWGDNLSGDAKLMVGKPIRVELVLTEDAAALQTGYTVEKLQLNELDRVSDYGIWANEGDPWFADETYMVPGVYDAGALLTITNVASGDVVVDEPATAEINSKGRVVYGYNLRVTAAGEYDLKFTVPNVEFKSINHGATHGVDSTTIRIDVIPGGGGGGKPDKVK